MLHVHSSTESDLAQFCLKSLTAALQGLKWEERIPSPTWKCGQELKLYNPQLRRP